MDNQLFYGDLYGTKFINYICFLTHSFMIFSMKISHLPIVSQSIQQIHAVVHGRLPSVLRELTKRMEEIIIFNCQPSEIPIGRHVTRTSMNIFNLWTRASLSYLSNHFFSWVWGIVL